MLVGYLFLLIFRPYEYWTILGEIRIERIYMIFFMMFVFFSRERKYISSPINGSIVIFFIFLVISGVFAISFDASLFRIEEYFKFLVFYFVTIMSIKDEEDFRFVVLGFLAVMFVYVGKSSWEFFVHGRYEYRMGIKRMLGIDVTYGNPNAFAASIVYSLPLLWAMIRCKFQNIWLQRGLWSYGVLSIVAIVFTGSRSGMVTALLFFLIVLASSKQKLLATTCIFLVLFISWQFMPEDLHTRFLSTFYDDVGPQNAQMSAEGRLEGFLHGMEIFMANPFVGVGPGNYPLSWDIRMNAHNFYGQLLGELGLLGGLGFGILLILMIIQNRSIIRSFKSISIQSDAEILQIIPLASDVGTGNPRKVHRLSSEHRGISCKPFFENLGPVPLVFYSFVAQAIIQTIILMLFKGWGDHNLYRYTWLWLAALTVLGHHLFYQEVKRIGQS